MSEKSRPRIAKRLDSAEHLLGVAERTGKSRSKTLANLLALPRKQTKNNQIKRAERQRSGEGNNGLDEKKRSEQECRS